MTDPKAERIVKTLEGTEWKISTDGEFRIRDPRGVLVFRGSTAELTLAHFAMALSRLAAAEERAEKMERACESAINALMLNPESCQEEINATITELRDALAAPQTATEKPAAATDKG